MDPDTEFRELVRLIFEHRAEIDAFWRSKGDFAHSNWADEYVKESQDGRSFEKQVETVTSNIRTGGYSRDRSAKEWAAIIKTNPEVFPLFQKIEEFVRANLLKFLRLYYVGWKDQPKRKSVVPTTTSPGQTKRQPSQVTPKRQQSQRSQPKTFSAGQGPREEPASKLPEAEYEPPLPNFSLPRKGGIFRTFEELGKESVDEEGKLWLIQYQNVFPTHASIKALGEQQYNSCYGKSWAMVYTVPQNPTMLEAGEKIKTVQFVKKDRPAFSDLDSLVVKTVPVTNWDADYENVSDIVIGSRLNFFLEAKLVRGFVRLVDWFVCRGEFSELKDKKMVKENKRMIQTVQEKADAPMIDICSGRNKRATLTIALLANLLLTLEAAQDLFEYVHYDMHTGNVFVKKVPADQAPSVLEFNRPYGQPPFYLDMLETDAQEVKIIDYGRNRLRVSYVFSDSTSDRLIGPPPSLRVLGISSVFNPQYDMKVFALAFAARLDGNLKGGVQIAKGDQDQIFDLLDEMSGSRYIRTTRDDFAIPLNSLRPEDQSKLTDKGLDFGVWANCVYNWTRYDADHLEGTRAMNFGKTKTTLERAESKVLSVLREFKKKGMRYLIETSIGERKTDKPNELGYLPTVWTLICFWGWTPFVWNGQTPSTLLSDLRFFDSLRNRPSGRDIVKAVEYRSLTEFKESSGPSIGGSSSWWHKLWNRSTPSAELEDFPDFHRVFEVQGVLGQGSEGLVIEVVDQKAPHTRRVLKLLPSLSLGDEHRSHVLLQEAKIHMLVDQICPAAPEYYGLFRVPIGPLVKKFPNFPAWLNVWDPSGRLAKEQSMIGILMESIDGITLRSFIGSLFRNNQTLNEDGLSLLLLQLALQVKCLHDANIVHRDLSLANVMLDEANGRQARIIDFGLATAADNPLPPTKEGRWDYVAPESRTVQRYGTRWRRSSGDLTKLDIYSLGMILLKAGNRAVFEQEQPSLEEAPFEPLQFYNMDNLIPDSNYLSRLCYLMLSEDPASRPTIDTVIQLIQMAKPELAPVTSEFERLWKLTKEYAERVFRSVISGKTKQLKQHRHRSPVRPS